MGRKATERDAAYVGTCPSGKYSYGSKARAKRELGPRGRKGRAYRCVDCGAFHVTAMTYADTERCGLNVHGKGHASTWYEYDETNEVSP